MKLSKLIDWLFIVIFLNILINGCSVNDKFKNDNVISTCLKNESQLMFAKCPNLDWKNKKVVVSFEDDFKNFISIETLGYTLSHNNLNQGITVKLKIVDFENKATQINEIMIEPFDLSEGTNEFAVGYTNNKTYLIY